MLRWLTSIVLALVVVLGPAAPIAGAAPSLTESTSQTNSSACPPAGLWVALPNGTGPQPAPGCPPHLPVPDRLPSSPATTTGRAAPSSTGGPNDYGYTWDDSLPFNWIDATGGTDTGLSGYSSGSHTGSIALPFAFKYFENTYPSVYIAGSGYLSFLNLNYWPAQGNLPSPAMPNNIIAPYWSPFQLNASGPAGRVFYASGGSTPNRYFVAEWNQVAGGYGINNYSFEVVLHENGDIDFQYGTMNYGSGSYDCGAAGIEDALGIDGLGYGSFCSQAPSTKTVRFHRPAPSARVGVFPLFQGSLAHADQVIEFTVPIHNIGELGTDTYDITPASAWPVSLFAADGVTPLVDTNSNSIVDTGPVAQGSAVNIVAKVHAPPGAVLGDYNNSNLTIRSSLNAGKTKLETLQAGVPAPFAQVYVDAADYASSLFLATPDAQASKQATNDFHYGNDPAVATAPGGNLVYAWDTSRCVTVRCTVSVEEVEYAILNPFGELVRGVTKLVDNSGASDFTYDYSPALAVAPDGHVEILWVRELAHYTGSTSQYNYNIFAAILDAAGNRISGPTNLTNNGAWFNYSQSQAGIDYMSTPAIAATDDNRFVLAWERETYAGPGCSSNCYPNELLYAVQATNGAVVKSPTLLAAVPPGSSNSFYYPALSRLNGDRALLAFSQQGDIKFVVLDSSGNTVTGMTNITTDGYSPYDYRPDAVQLSGSNTVVAWTASGTIRFAVLNGSYNVASGPTALSNPAALTGSDYVSIASDTAHHAILTWMDYDYSSRRNLYYALVNGSGAVLTAPMIFRMSTAAPPDIQSSYLGFGNTNLSATAGTDAYVRAEPMTGAPPGGAGFLPIQYGNHGTTTATAVTITATLGVSVTYLSDTSGVTPTVAGNTVVWTLPNLAWLDQAQFGVALGIPNAPYGTTFPVGLTIHAAEPEVTPADNTLNVNLFAAYQLFLPEVRR